MTSESRDDIEALVAEAALQEPARNTVFAAEAEDPRARRPADAVELVVSSVVLLLAAWAYGSNTELDGRVLEFFSGGLPGWLSATLTIVFIVGGLYAIGLVLGILLFGKGRRAIARDMFLAPVLATVVATGMSQLAGSEWPDIIPELLERDGVPSYPVVRLSFAVAIITVANPYLSVPMRSVGRRMLWAMTIAALVMSYGSVTAIIGAVAHGSAAAAAIHLIFGSGVGDPAPRHPG